MRRHSFDAFSFVLGVLFAAIGIAFLFGNVDLGDLHLGGLWPLPLILIGVLMLVSTIQRRSRPELQPAPPPAAAVAYDARTHVEPPGPQAAETEAWEPAAATHDIGGLEDDEAPDTLEALDEHDRHDVDGGESAAPSDGGGSTESSRERPEDDPPRGV